MRILLVEDDTFFRKFYARKLKENGFEVEEAGDGQEGLEKIEKFKPDFLLLDLIMPKKDGFELLSELQKKPEFKSMPILVFSTLGQEKDIEKARQLGAWGYANKRDRKS